MEEYLKTLLEQIRCKQAKGMVESEIRGHMEEQIADNLAEGMEESQAVEAAVEDMGNPVEVGIAMDALHRPRISWSMIVLVGIISLLSIVIQVVIGNSYASYMGKTYIVRHVLFVILGFLMMIGIYRLDYSFVGKYAKRIAFLGTVFLYIGTNFFSACVNGANTYLNIGMRFVPYVSLRTLLYFFVPLYAGILYQYYGKGYKGVGACILWLLLPVFMAIKMSSITQAGLLFLIQGILLSIAVWKDWFRIRKRRFLLSFWGVSILFPICALTLAMKGNLLAPYQMERIESYLHPFSKLGNDYFSSSFFLREYILKSKLIGAGPEINMELAGGPNSYIFTFLSTRYGILAAGIVAALVFFVGVKAWKLASRQKNQLGMLIGYGCALLFLAMTLLNLADATGMIPPTASFLPFISQGGSNLMISYALLGLVLSVYRYKDILPADRKKNSGNSVA